MTDREWKDTAPGEEDGHQEVARPAPEGFCADVPLFDEMRA